MDRTAVLPSEGSWRAHALFATAPVAALQPVRVSIARLGNLPGSKWPGYRAGRRTSSLKRR